MQAPLCTALGQKFRSSVIMIMAPAAPDAAPAAEPSWRGWIQGVMPKVEQGPRPVCYLAAHISAASWRGVSIGKEPREGASRIHPGLLWSKVSPARQVYR